MGAWKVSREPHRGRSRVLRVAKGSAPLTGKMVEYERRKVNTLGQSRESQGTKHGNVKDWMWMTANPTCERLIPLPEWPTPIIIFRWKRKGLALSCLTSAYHWNSWTTHNKGSWEMGSVLEMGFMTVQKSWEER